MKIIIDHQQPKPYCITTTMNKKHIAQLGLSEKDIEEKLIERLFQFYTEEESGYKTDFDARVEKAVKAKVDERLDSTVKKLIAPKIGEMVDGICLEETNKWGEKKGTKLTFTEYLTQRVDAYIREEVNYTGKSRSEDNNYGWTKSSTRIVHLIHEHLQFHINRAVADALGQVNSSIRKGLEEAVKHAIASVQVKINTEVKTP